MIHVQLENGVSNHDKRIHTFVEHFVRGIIKEAVKRSSSILRRDRSKSGPRFEPIDAKQDLLFKSRPVASTSAKRCNQTNSTFLPKSVSEDLYTLPVDTVRKVKPKKSNQLKPIPIRPFGGKSQHRSLCDFKYVLLKFYSNGVTSKKIGSEHSAFTKYQCRRSNKRLATQVDSKRGNSRTELQRAAIMKSGSDLRRWKRCNFFDLKNSVCGVFKSHKKLAKDSTLDETTFRSFKDRSLPPLPGSYENSTAADSTKYDDENGAYDADVEFGYGNYAAGCVKKTRAFDFASSIEKVKDCGWYWGPMSSESAEKLLANEKDGSFIVRDSSDDRYIFSLTFKLNSSIMHVRIEHGQGNFSFGNYTNFKSHTIVEFIENTVQHSKSGRYLFFQYRHPIEGPMEVQLLYPVSRFKRVQSLQHMCRFVILKSVRRDLISSLPLPKPLIEYLSSKDYYAEEKF